MRGARLFTMTVLAILAFSGCTTVDIKDEQIIGSLGTDGGVQFDTNDPAEVVLTDDQVIAIWHDTSKPMCMMSSTALTDYKSEIEKLCTVASCTEEQQVQLAGVLRVLTRLQMTQPNSTSF